MTKFSNKFKKPYFWPIFPIFWAKIFFSKNSALSRTTPHSPLTPCYVSEKTNELIPRKFPDGRTEGWMLIHRALMLTVRGPKILQTDWSRVFSGITQNSMIFFVASMEVKNQLDTSYSF